MQIVTLPVRSLIVCGVPKELNWDEACRIFPNANAFGPYLTTLAGRTILNVSNWAEAPNVVRDTADFLHNGNTRLARAYQLLGDFDVNLAKTRLRLPDDYILMHKVARLVAQLGVTSLDSYLDFVDQGIFWTQKQFDEIRRAALR